MQSTLIERDWQADVLDESADYLYRPGISVLAPAHLACQTGVITSMHDPTEGGVATGLREIETAAQVGLEVDLVPDLASRLCAEFGLDPLGTIASGSLLATVAPDHAQQILDLWHTHGFSATIIGRVTSQESRIRGYRNSQATTFPEFSVDEITKLWQ